MKTRSWTRVLSTLLTVAMIATLLVVPAGAAAGQTYTTKGSAISDTYFTAGSDLVADTKQKATFDDLGQLSASLKATGGTKSSNPGRYISFKTDGAATVTIWWYAKAVPVLTTEADSTTTGAIKNSENTADPSSASAGKNTYRVTAAGTYYISCSQAFRIFQATVVEDAAATKYKATVATGITGGTVTLKVGEAAAAAEVEAAEGTVVNIVTAANTDYKLTANSIKVTKADDSEVTLEADGKSFKMPAGAVTVTAAFEADTRDDTAIVNDVVAAVKAALTGYSEVAQADVNTVEAAKAAVTAKIANVDKQGCTIQVGIIDSDFSAATAGDEEKPNGTDGSFKYTVAVQKGSIDNMTTTGTVTIKATPKAYTKDELSAVIGQARTAMQPYGGGNAADVFPGKKVVPADTMKALTDAIKAAQIVVDASGSTSVQYGEQVVALKAAITIFNTAVENVTATGTKNPAAGYVLTADEVYTNAQADTANWAENASTAGRLENKNVNYVMASQGTNGYFKIQTRKSGSKSRLDVSEAVFSDGYEGGHRINLNGAMASDSAYIGFTVSSGATANVKVWWVSNGTDRSIKLNGATENITPAAGSVLTEAKNIPVITAWENLPAGEYKLGATNGNYFFRVEVQETGPAAGAAPTFATNGGDTYQVTKADVAAGTVSFTLADNAPAGAIYKLYTLNGGTYTQINVSTNGVTADANKKITFVLDNDHKGALTGTSAGTTTYYVSSTETDKGESDKTEVTVKRYVPVTGVKLTHFTATTPGSGSEVAGTVGHVLYEKLKSDDADVIGGAETPNVKYPNGWVLKAIVEPADATDQSVVFSNARVTPEFINVEEDGTVTVIKAGTGRVRVTSVSEPSVTAAFDLTVKVRIGAVEIQNADGTAAATTVAMGKTLPLKAVVTASASASQSHQEVTWNTSDATIATVSAAGVVTPVKPGEVKITATSAQDSTVKDELTLTVTKGTPALSFTTGNPQVTSSGKVRFKLSGVPAGVTPTFTVKLGNDTKDVTVYELANDTDYNYYADMPANETGATVTYTVTAKVDGNDSWNAAEKSVEVKVLDVNAKNIYIVSPGTDKDVELTQGSTKLEVIAQVNKAGGVKDDAATAALTYKWTKDGEAMSDTTYAITVDTAGVYVCTVTSADAAVETKEATVTFTVTAPVSALTDIDVTPAAGVDYTAATGALKITGPVDATFTVTTTPAEGHGDTLVAVSSTPSVARVSLVDGKLTITPWSTGETTITIRGTAAADVKKEIKVTVVKAAAPAALTTDDYTVTQPTVAGGKGTITITQNAPEGTEYVYRKGDSGAWIKFPANKTIEVEPGTYKIRVYVPKPELQETTNGVAVEIKEFTAAPTVASVAVTSTADSLEEGKTLQLTAQVHMSNNTVSATETVTWTTSDATVATVSATGLVTGVKAGTVTITATSVTDSTKAGSKTLTVTAKQGGGDEPTPPTPVDKTALNAAIADAEKLAADTYTVADDTTVSQVKRGTKFVTDSDQAALAAAIAAAKAVAADADATEADVADAQKALADAVAAFNAAIQTGTKRTSGGLSPNPGTRPGGNTTSSNTVDNPAGGKTTVKKDGQGNVTITATDGKGEVIAEVKIPATIPGVGYKFVDVPEGHWAEDAINEMAGLKLVKGVDEEQHLFDMTSPITRGAVATILSRLANGKATVGDTFSDVAEGQWFAEGVAWAAKAGVVNGFEDGTFGPNGSITREQLAVMIARYAKLLGIDTTAAAGELAVFTDADSVQSWAVEGMAWCVKVGIIQGRGNGIVDPSANASRAEATVMLNRLVELLAK